MTQSPDCGLELDSLRPSLVRASSMPDDTKPLAPIELTFDAPPSALLGVLPGENLTIDRCHPLDRRGTGLSIDNETVVGRDLGSGRFPICYAWERLLGDGQPWRWRTADRSISCEPADALAALTRDLLSDSRVTAAAPCLVVPNGMTLEQQDGLLQALRRAHVHATLLWRPVAAALAWSGEEGVHLPRHGDGDMEEVGELLHVHLGLESFEITKLALVHVRQSGRSWIVPGRRLPGRDQGLLLGAGRWLSEAASRDVLRNEQQGIGDRWNLLWCSAWLDQALATAKRRRALGQLPPWLPEPMVRDGAHALMRRAKDPRRWRDSRWGVFEQPHADTAAADPLRALLETVSISRKPNAALVTGPLAALPDPAGASLGERFVSLVCPELHRARVCVAGNRGCPVDLLARGAAVFVERQRKGQPTYLDTLPQVETIARERGEPRWLNLLENERNWATGGEEWRRDWRPGDRKTSFAIPSGTDFVELSIARYGHPTVKRVRSEFREPARSACPVTLTVRMTPGQGSPRVEVKPDDLELVKGRTVYLDWDTARDTGLTREEELANEPLWYPQLEPRKPSRHLWSQHHYIGKFRRLGPDYKPSGLKELLIDCNSGALLARISQRRPPSPERSALARALELLLREVTVRDRAMEPDFGAAISSDCRVVSDQSILDQFVLGIDTCLENLTGKEFERAIRLLGYCSADTPTLRRHIKRFLKKPVTSQRWLRQAYLVACGNCLRTPSDARQFLARAAAGQLNTDWTNALSRLLMYRDDALADCSSRTLVDLATRLCRIVEGEVARGHLKLVFRYAALCLAYLLRRRRFDDEFLSPGDPVAIQIKSVLLEAKSGIESRRIREMGGFVNLAELIDIIVGFLDLRGRGRLVALAFDTPPEGSGLEG